MPYALPPYASIRVASDREGATKGAIARGLICGILLARVVAGGVAEAFGWRTVYLTCADIAGRTSIYGAPAGLRSRLNALYAIAMFAGGATSSVLVGPLWATTG